MISNINPIEGKPRAIANRIIATDMYFGEQKTDSGLIIKDDNGTTRGIYPRWCRVYSIGPEVDAEFEVGDWILVDHGRWTRAYVVDDGNGPREFRTIEAESVLLFSNEKPKGVQLGAEFADGEHATVDPSSFIR